MERRPTPRARRVTRLAAGAATAALLGSSLLATASPASAAERPAAPSRPTEGGAPTLSPDDGAFLEGPVTFAAGPTVADDSVTTLTIDGDPVVGAEPTVGVSHLAFDVGSNSAAVSYRNFVVVNGHRIDQNRTWVSERVALEVPNEYLVVGENTVEFHAGTAQTACGTNYDDFVISHVGLELLGEVADGEENEYTYTLGDGDCGTQPTDVTTVELSFFVQDDPRRTTGLSAHVDTASLANGTHEVVATTRSGKSTTHTVRVNNAPVGAPTLTPTDGTLVAGEQTVIGARPAGADGGGTAALTVDGEDAAGPETLGSGAATLSFDVGTNSIERRYQNHVLVNGNKLDLGGDHASTRVTVPVPNRYLVPGENTVTVVTGDISSTCGANRDDFTISAIELTPSQGTATPVDVAPTYALGDGSCGSDTTIAREAELHWSIDAPATTTLPTLGSGHATVSLVVGSNSLDGAALNKLVVNGMEQTITQTIVNGRGDITVPNEWLLPGWNTVEVVTAAFPGDCNRDDFTISEVTLTPAYGTAVAQGQYASYALGDGTCGSNINLFREVDLHFLVDDVPAQGLRADLDTATLGDGEHELAATSTTGEASTRTLVSDNTAPEVAASTPEEGGRIRSSLPLAVELTDASGIVSGPEVTLDGEAIVLGDLVGPGLSAGSHTLAVTATDSLGNTATREVEFASAGIPDVPTDLSPAQGSTDVGRTATLGARVSEPDGGTVTARFSEAEILSPHSGFQGTATEVPSTLKVKGEKVVRDLRALAPADDRSIEAPTSRDVTFQRFDVKVPKRADSPVVRWEGTIDPQRIATLRVWNTETRTWDPLASASGAVEGATVLQATVAEDHVDRSTVHVMVTGEDPFADDIDPGDPNGFADPDDYDFSIAHFTDTQYLSEGAVEQETAEERAVWEAAYQGVTDWIVDNAEERKISYVAHTGDITENNIRPPANEAMRQQVIGEFELSSRIQATLDDAGVPNGVLAGNHDNQSGLETGPESTYNQYYGPGRYENAAKTWGDASYGGPWREGDNQNHYDLFSAGGLDFVVVSLSYGVTREEAAWADSVFKRFPDRNGILLTHSYLAAGTEPDGRAAGFAAPDGSPLFQEVVAPNPNVFLILAGHIHGVGTNVKPEVGQIAHGVVEMLADYQAYTVSAERLGLTQIGGYNPTDQLRFGASFLRLLQFDVDRGEMIVDTYSPFLDNFGATEFDTAPRWNGQEDNMVLPVDLTSRTTTFTTDSVGVFVPTHEIGRDTVASGELASVRWRDLEPDTAYAWIVTARSSGGGVTTAEPQVFVTRDAGGRPGRGDDMPWRSWFHD